MSARPRRAAVASALAVLALACGTPREERQAPPPGPVPAAASGVEVVGDPAIERQLATTIRSRTVEDGLARVAFDLASRAPTKLVVAWRVEWFDRDGRALASAPDAWRRLVLPAGGTVSLEARAPVPEADSWRLRAVDSRSLE